jgi:hypothetical protein
MRKTLTICGVLAVGLAGCGSSNNGASTEAQDYAVRVQSAQFQFASAFEKATNSLLTSSDPKHDAIALRAAAKAVDNDVATLRRIAPPTQVRRLHSQLVTAMRTYSGRLGQAAHLIAGGDPKAFVVAKRVLSDSSQQVKRRFNTIISQINAKLT